MDEPKRGTKIFIGEQDIYLWMKILKLFGQN